MVIKKISALCKSAKQIVLLDSDSGRQWAGDGNAFYELIGMPTLGERSICVVMDIPPDKAAGMIIRRDHFPAGYNTDEDDDTGRYMAYNMDNGIKFEGLELMPVSDGIEMYVIQPKYLAPLADLAAVTLEARTSPKGDTYIVAKDGMFVVAIIMPEEANTRTTQWIGDTHYLAVKAVRRAKAESEARDEGEE